MKYLTLFAVLLSLFTQKIAAQQCSDYPCVIKKVKRFIADKKYTDAFDNLESADGYPAKKADEISAHRNQLFAAIEKEKDEAKKARVEAERAKDEAKKALEQVEIEKQTAITEKNKAQAAEDVAKIALKQVEIEKQTAIGEKTKAQAAQAKTDSVLNMIYFYDDKFGLAYDKYSVYYGFIDKNLSTKIEFKYK